MKHTDHIDLKGRLHLTLKDHTGSIVKAMAADNDIVLTGRDLVAKLFINEPIATISHLAIGTGTGAVDDQNDIALGNEIFRKAIDPIDPSNHLSTTTQGKKKVLISTELGFTEGNGAITEAGLFNDPLTGEMYNRVVFPAVNKTQDFTLTFVWEVIF